MLQVPSHTNLCRPDVSLQWGSLTIEEPVTVLTDLCITIICWILCARTWKTMPSEPVRNLYLAFFFTIGLATLFGAFLGHAFCSSLGIQWKLPGWILSMTAVMMAERASIVRLSVHLSPLGKKFLSGLNLLELSLLLVLVLKTHNFFYVEFHAFYGFVIVVGVLEAWHLSYRQNKTGKLLLLSVFISSLAAAAHVFQWHLSVWFTATDLAHIIMCLNAWVLFKAVESNTFEYEIINSGLSDSGGGR